MIQLTKVPTLRIERLHRPYDTPVDEYLTPAKRSAIEAAMAYRKPTPDAARFYYFVLTTRPHMNTRPGKSKASTRLSFTDAAIDCFGEVFDGKGLATLFFEYKGKRYMAQRANGWRPLTSDFFPSTAAYPPRKECGDRLLWIFQTFLLT